MGCNCKKTAEKARKYTDDETISEVHGTERAAMIISKFFIVILLFIILIIVVPILIVYSIFAVIAGKDIKIGKFLKKYGKRKQNIPNQN